MKNPVENESAFNLVPVKDYLLGLQDRICAGLERIDAVETFQENRKSLQNNHLISAYIDFLVNKTINDEMSIK